MLITLKFLTKQKNPHSFRDEDSRGTTLFASEDANLTALVPSGQNCYLCQLGDEFAGKNTPALQPGPAL